jgi:hypothetical protein
LRSLNGLLPGGLKFGVHTYVERDRYYYITATSEDAARLIRLLAVAAPSASGRYLSPKFEGFVEEARVDVRPGEGGIRRTPSGLVAADLTISEGGIEVKYNAYLRSDEIELRFKSMDRSRAELAARLLKMVNIGTEVKKADGEGKWYVWATTDKLAAGHKKLRDGLAKIVETALARGWVDEGTARRWLEKLERGLTLKEEWPKYHVGLTYSGALVVRYRSANPDGIEQVAEQLRDVGLEEGRHFTVKKPEGGKRGYVSILREGLERAAWLSVHGSGEERRLAAEFIGYILQRASEEGGDVYRKALEIVERGKAVGSLRLEGFEKEVDGRLVKVIGGGAQFEVSRSGKTLLRITITAEVDGVRRDYTITFSRRGTGNAAVGFAYARADAPGGREADAERFSALIKALTGKGPRVRRMKDGEMVLEYGREHLDGFARYAELADAIKKWLEETRQ